MRTIQPKNFSVCNATDAIVINRLLEAGFSILMDEGENIFIEGKYFTKGHDLTKEENTTHEIIH